MGQLVRFGVAMDEELLGRFDELVARRGTAANRSEAVRDLVRDALVDEQWEAPDEEIVGTITMVFDHHANDLAEKLDALQHAHHDKIVSARCTCTSTRTTASRSSSSAARAAQIRGIAEGLLGTKGVKHGKLVTTTTGRHL